MDIRRISTPRTKYSSEPIDTVPLYGLQLMKRVIGGLFPELTEIGFTDSRVSSSASARALIQEFLLIQIKAVLVHGQHR
jgi:hypothetical protein